MISFRQLNLHKAEQATALLGQELSGRTRTVGLLTEPHTVQAQVTGMPRGSRVIYDRKGKKTGAAPRAAIVHSADVNITALEAHLSLIHI